MAQKKTIKKASKSIIPKNKEILHARRDLILNIVIPIIKKQGFSNINEILEDKNEPWGWCSGRGYHYTLYKIANGKFIVLHFGVYVTGGYLTMDMYIFNVSSLTSEQEVSINADLWERIRWKEIPYYLYPGCAKHTKDWWYYRHFIFNFCYRLRFFITRLGFKLRVRQLKKQLIRDFSNVQSIVDICISQRTPDILDFLNQKIIKSRIDDDYKEIF